jgi:hypothetical protein
MAITGYVITPYNVDTGTQLTAINVPGGNTFYDIGGLQQGTTYRFLIYAQNAAGNGAVATSENTLLARITNKYYWHCWYWNCSYFVGCSCH